MDPIEIKNCYDFPRAVLHRASGDCPRYAGGTCRPLPTPVEPYTLEEAAAVEGYRSLLTGELHEMEPVRARGRTEVAGEPLENTGDVLAALVLASGAFADEVADEETKN